MAVNLTVASNDPNKPIELEIKQDPFDPSRFVVVANKQHRLISFEQNGTLRLFQGVNETFGFQLDKQGQIIVTDVFDRALNEDLQDEDDLCGDGYNTTTAAPLYDPMAKIFDEPKATPTFDWEKLMDELKKPMPPTRDVFRRDTIAY